MTEKQESAVKVLSSLIIAIVGYATISPNKTDNLVGKGMFEGLIALVARLTADEDEALEILNAAIVAANNEFLHKFGVRLELIDLRNVKAEAEAAIKKMMGEAG